MAEASMAFDGTVCPDPLLNVHERVEQLFKEHLPDIFREAEVVEEKGEVPQRGGASTTHSVHDEGGEGTMGDGQIDETSPHGDGGQGDDSVDVQEGEGGGNEGGAAEAAEAHQEQDEDEYSLRVKSVEEAFERETQSINALIEDLTEAKEKAAQADIDFQKRADELYTPLQRKTGLPLPSSFLMLDAEKVAEAKLINAQDIFQQNERYQLSLIANPKTMAVFEPETKGYLKRTKTVSVRASTVTVKKSRLLFTNKATGKSLSTEEIQHKLEASAARRKKMAKTMAAGQRDTEFRLMKQMHQKLSFVRNPRYDEGGLKGRSNGNPSKAMLTAVPGISVIVEPVMVEFTRYSIGAVHRMEVQIRNVSTVSRRIRLLPPESKYFSISSVQFPSDGGYVAPGMHCRFAVAFEPDTLGDYATTMTILTDLEKHTYDICARRRSPVLSLPSFLDVGLCLVGNIAKKTFPCENTGGDGDFLLVDGVEAETAEWPEDIPESARGSLALEPCFVASPGRFALGNGDRVSVAVEFSPPGVGYFKKTLYVKCDDCKIREFFLRGTGIRVDTRVAAVDGTEPAEGALALPLWFGSQVPGGITKRSITIYNATPTTVPFEWQQVALPSPGYEHQEPKPPVGQDAGVFSVTPRSGTLQAEQSMDFEISFEPREVERYSRSLQLFIDTLLGLEAQVTEEDTGCRIRYKRGPGVPNQQLSLAVQVGGAGSTYEVQLSTPILKYSGSLLIGKQYSKLVTLENRSEARAEFAWEGLPPGYHLSPARGSIDAGETVAVTVELVRDAPGPRHDVIHCAVASGGRLSLELFSEAEPLKVSFGQPVVNLGRFKMMDTGTAELLIRNENAVPIRWDVECPLENVCFSETTGWLPAFSEYHAVQVSMVGKDPAVVKSSIAVTPRGGGGSSGGGGGSSGGGRLGIPQYVGMRATVLEPKVVLDDHVIEVGTAFVGVAVTKTLTLRNIGELAANFVWDAKPLERAPWLVRITPESGTVVGHGSVDVEVTLVPLSSENVPVEFPVACDIMNAKNPIGFIVKAEVRSLEVRYSVLQSKPGEGAQSEQKKTVLCEQHSKTDAIVLDFGRECQIRERNSVVLAIQNLTGISAPVSLFLDEFEAGGGGGGVQNTSTSRREEPNNNIPLPSTRGSSRPSTRRTRMTLSDMHETTKFFSRSLGQTIISTRNEEHLDKMLLREAKGIALSLDKRNGILDAHGTVYFTLTCYNSMPGEYLTHVNVQVGDLDTFTIPLRIGVIGSPLILREERVLRGGFSAVKRSPFETLRFGSHQTGGASCVKEFWVSNDGPFDMEVAWCVKAKRARPCSRDGVELRMSVREKKMGLAALAASKGRNEEYVVVSMEEKLDDESEAFDVYPSMSTIEAGKSACVKVTFHPKNADTYKAIVFGTQIIRPIESPLRLRLWDNNNCKLASSSDSNSDSNSDSEGQGQGEGEEEVVDFRALLIGGYHPHAAAAPVPFEALRVNLLADSIEAELKVSDDVVFTTFSCDRRGKHPSYFREVTLTNTCNTPLSFALAIEEPFSIMSAVASIAQPVTTTMQASSGNQGLYFLAPRESIKLDIRFDPRRRVDLEDYVAEGSIAIAFSNGRVQRVPVRASVTHPSIIVSPRDLMDFGEVHVDAPRSMSLLLTNPTRATAEWSVGSSSGAAFVVTPNCGAVEGRGKGHAKTQEVTVTFNAPEDVLCEEEIAFSVFAGRGCALRLRGKGSYDEVVE